MMFEQSAIRWMSAVHEFWYRLSDGWIGGNVMGAPILLLDTTGRKTGRRYTTPLLYLSDGDDLIVIASNGGADSDPRLGGESPPDPTVQGAGPEQPEAR